jgi:hypothetical protein
MIEGSVFSKKKIGRTLMRGEKKTYHIRQKRRRMRMIHRILRIHHLLAKQPLGLRSVASMLHKVDV